MTREPVSPLSKVQSGSKMLTGRGYHWVSKGSVIRCAMCIKTLGQQVPGCATRRSKKLLAVMCPCIDLADVLLAEPWLNLPLPYQVSILLLIVWMPVKKATTVTDMDRKGLPLKAGILIPVLNLVVTSTLKHSPPQIHKHLMSVS